MQRGWGSPVVWVLVAALAVGGCRSNGDSGTHRGPVTVPPTVTAPKVAVPKATTTRGAHTELPPDRPGPYGVGRTTVVLVDTTRADRALTTDVWYPIDPTPDAAPSIYQFDERVPPSDVGVAKAGVPVAGDGPFPLIVFSHGSPSIRYQSLFFTELLASHGFVVAAPDHTGDSAVDALRATLDPPATVAANRPADVSFAIDRLTDGAVAEPVGLRGAVDAGRVGIVGHSGGGDTVLAVAGGRGGVDPDRRVDAVLAWTPASLGVDDASLAAIEVPTMLFGASLDDIAPPSVHVDRPWDLVSGHPTYRVDLGRGGHDQFTNVCDFLAAADADPAFPANLRPLVDVPAADACTAEFLPIADAQRLIARYSAAFLLRHVAGIESAGVWLTADAAAETPEVVLTTRP